MRNVLIIGGIFVALTMGVLVTQERSADAAQIPAAQVETAQDQAPDEGALWGYELESLQKRCSFNSDCSHGTCKQNRCGGCSFNSDCKGWGKCSNGWCGACSFASECKGFGSCSGGRCTKSPY